MKQTCWIVGWTVLVIVLVSPAMAKSGKGNAGQSDLRQSGYADVVRQQGDNWQQESDRQQTLLQQQQHKAQKQQQKEQKKLLKKARNGERLQVGDDGSSKSSGLLKQRQRKSEQVQKELGKGSEQGQEAREKRRKWYRFWE